jgi:4-aminobutyrate aminotransferase-like enzyme
MIGYPMAGVAVRRDIAEAFSSSGIEYFNTFAGNSVACAIGDAVLEAIEQDHLQQNALTVGKELHERLVLLQSKFPCMGDVRGIGLFLGVEFIKPATTTSTPEEEQEGGEEADLVPNGALCKFVVDYLRYQRIITSRDGPDGNVLKLKPPLVFSQANVDQLMASLEEALTVAEKSGKF